jgi:hypothetical protein
VGTVAPRKKKKRKKKQTKAQKLTVLAAGLALVVCAVSVAVGLLNRYTDLDNSKIPRDIRIEVLNGTGEKGLAQKVAVALVKRRVDVLHVDNADNFDYEESVLIARKRRPELEPLVEMLGCTRFVEQLRDDMMVDATLIVGADYRRLNLGNGLDSDLLE